MGVGDGFLGDGVFFDDDDGSWVDVGDGSRKSARNECYGYDGEGSDFHW